MAEAIVSDITSGAVSFLLNKLSDALIEEAGLLVGVRPQVQWLLSELRWMDAFLKDADTKRGRGGELAKNWVREVREVAHQAEDIIDTYMLEIELRRQRSGLMGLIDRYAAFPSERKARHKVVAGLTEVKAKIVEIKTRKDTYGMVSLAETTIGQASSSNNKESQQQPTIRKRIIPPYRDEDDETIIVGFDDHKNNILKHLLNTNIRRRCVISVVGIGGIGKTTLANMVYNCSETKSYFEIRACISVSQDHRIGEMLKDIAKHAMGGTSNELQSLDIGELKGKVYNFLKGKRYLIVLDDVWRRDAWEETREALPDDKNGSRVMITTRSMEVATSADPTIRPFQLPLLSGEESWELFLKKAFFPDVKPSIPKELEDVGRQLVTRCEGLPLALLVLGGIVNSKKGGNPGEWRKVGVRMNWASTKEGVASLNILRLSVDDLPHRNLRHCFLYLAVFPEDHRIGTENLIRLWVAEGFIPQEQETMEEDTARDYVEELAHRSMIQVVDRSVVDGCVESFRIHDLFRDLCLREGRKDGFINSYTSYNIGVRRDDGMSSRASESRPPPRRIGLHGVTIDEMKRCYPTYSSATLRSLSIYHAQVSSEMFGGLKLLRVLHLWGIDSLVKLPEEITSMIHLRCLTLLYCHNLRELPLSIGNLRSLQTFVVMFTKVRRVLESLGRIKTLRHLILGHLESPPLGNLVNLESLDCKNTGGDEGFGKLLNIRDLNVQGLQSAQGTVFLDSLRKLTKLSSLTLESEESFSPELMTGLSGHDLLGQLKLFGQMPQLGHLIPPNLRTLHLNGSKLGQDPMSTLEKLPSLVLLELVSDAYVGKLMVCTASGFPRLRRLRLLSLRGLEEWRVEDGAMCSLTSLQIDDCGRLRMLPDRLRHLTSLQIDDCRKLRMLPDRLRHLTSLQINVTSLQFDVTSLQINVNCCNN